MRAVPATKKPVLIHPSRNSRMPSIAGAVIMRMFTAIISLADEELPNTLPAAINIRYHIPVAARINR